MQYLIEFEFEENDFWSRLRVRKYWYTFSFCFRYFILFLCFFIIFSLTPVQRMRRLRIVAVLKFWIEERVEDFAFSDVASSDLMAFLEGLPF
jgi:hypothetical protein